LASIQETADSMGLTTLPLRRGRDLPSPPPDRTLREDLIHLQRLGLIESEGYGRDATCA